MVLSTGPSCSYALRTQSKIVPTQRPYFPISRPAASKIALTTNEPRFAMKFVQDFRQSIQSFVVDGPWVIAAPVTVLMLYTIISTKFLQKLLSLVIKTFLRIKSTTLSSTSPAVSLQQTEDVVSIPVSSAAVTTKPQKLDNVGLEQAKLRVESILASLDEAKQIKAAKNVVEHDVKVMGEVVPSASVSSLSDKIGELTVQKLQTKLTMSNPTFSTRKQEKFIWYTANAVEDAEADILARRLEEKRVVEIMAKMKPMDDFRLNYDPIFSEWIERTGYTKSTTAVSIAETVPTSVSLSAISFNVTGNQQSAVENGRDRMIVFLAAAAVITPLLPLLHQ